MLEKDVRQEEEGKRGKISNKNGFVTNPVSKALESWKVNVSCNLSTKKHPKLEKFNVFKKKLLFL